MIRTLATCCLLVGFSAQAADAWSDPFPGVRVLHRTTSNQNIFVAVVNLCANGVSLRTTAHSERGRRTSSFGALVDAELAINGDFFSLDGQYKPDGITISGGNVWPGANDHTYVGLLAAGNERIELFSHQLITPPESWMQMAIGGHPTLINNGLDVNNNGVTSLCGGNRHPRTAVGITKDKRQLILAVADGRASTRIGLTCDELRGLMREMGAHNASAEDGGGSSTFWMKGLGVRNRPSDGSERVVGNHLAVFAKGSGKAKHCDRALDEVLYQGATRSNQGHTDIDGDGQSDICARDKDGIVCRRATATAFSAAIRGPATTDAAQWWWPTYSSSMRMGDVNGDGKSDVCMRFTDGFHCWPSTGSGFGGKWSIAEISGAGWAPLARTLTLQLADFNGDGRDDVCGRSPTGWKCWASTGSGFGPGSGGPPLPDSDGWDEESLYGTLQMGDVNGDGRDDVCGRTHLGYNCWLSSGTGFPTSIKGPPFITFVGWGNTRYWSTIRLADVNGDGKADVCGRTGTDYRCYLSTGSAFGSEIIGPAMADATGWNVHEQFSTIRLADIDGDGDLDLCARASNGIRCWKWAGSDFSTGAVVGPQLDNPAWANIDYYSTIRMGDVTGDGKDDLCVRSGYGVLCWASTGTAFSTTPIVGPPWAGNEWENPVYHATIRMGPTRRCTGPACLPKPDGGTKPDSGVKPDSGIKADAGTAPDGGPLPEEDGGSVIAVDGGFVGPLADGGTGGGPGNGMNDIGGGCGCTQGPDAALGAALCACVARFVRRRPRR